MRVYVACDHHAVAGVERVVTVIRPVYPDPAWPGARFQTPLIDLINSGAVKNLRHLGAAGRVTLWEANWVPGSLGQRQELWRKGHN